VHLPLVGFITKKCERTYRHIYRQFIDALQRVIDKLFLIFYAL